MPLHILVADDDAAIRAFFLDLLELEGYRVTLVPSVEDAEQAVQREQIDVLILDYRFGADASGQRWLRTLHTTPSTAHLPVIVCTVDVRALRADAPYFAAHGIVAVAKLFSVDDFLTVLHRILLLPDVPA